MEARLLVLLLIASLPIVPHEAESPGPPVHLYGYRTSAHDSLLMWDPPLDNSQVAGYFVYRFGTRVGKTPSTQYRDSNLSMGTAYAYTISAFDAAGKESAQSAAVTVVMPFTDGVLAVGGDTPCAPPAALSEAVQLALKAIRQSLPHYLADADTYEAAIAPYRKSNAPNVVSSLHMVDLSIRLLRTIPEIVQCDARAFQYAVTAASLESIDAGLPYFLAHAQHGTDPYAGMKSGVIAVKSAVDSYLDYYYFSLPPNYDPAVRYRLNVTLHPAAACIWEAGGFPASPVQSVVAVGKPGGRSASGHPASDAIYMIPCARGSGTSYATMAQTTVLDEIADISRRFSVDRNRVTVRGASMGGTGAVRLATLYPDWFAGAGLITGTPAYRLPPRDFRYDAGMTLSNLKNTRFVVWGSPGDTSTFSVDDALVSAFRTLAAQFPGFYGFQSYSDPAGSHGVIAPALLARGEDFLAQGRRNAYPASVHYATGSEQYDGAYWVRGMLRADSRQPANIDVDASSGGTVSVQTSNLRGFSLDLSAANTLFTGRPALSIQIDGTAKPLQVPAGGTVYCNRAAAKWEFSETAPRGLIKHNGVSGPMADLYMRYPVLMVYGTGRGNTAAHGSALAAELLQATFGSSNARDSYLHYGPFTIKADHEVTPEDVASSNLVLFGTPDENSIVSRIAPQLPLRFAGHEISVAGRSYTGADVGWSVLYPNPLNPSRYVLLASEHNNMSSLSSSAINSHLLQNDYIVVEAVKGLNSRKVIVEGSFDQNWH